MKRNTLEKLYLCLKNEMPEIERACCILLKKRRKTYRKDAGNISQVRAVTPYPNLKGN
jgi:hypothetical protein